MLATCMYTIMHATRTIRMHASKKLCKYGFPHTLMTNTHFDKNNKLWYIKRTNCWLYNANPWILASCRCNHNVKFIVASRKDTKAIIYYITNYIIKSSTFTSNINSLLQIAIKRIETAIDPSTSNDFVDRFQHLLIKSINIIGSQ